MKPKLTLKQELFCKEYIVDFNATQAAIRAGYSEKTAKEQGYDNLTKPHIQQIISKEIESKFNEVDLTAKKVLDEIIKLAFSNIKDVYDASGNLIPVHQLPDDVAACIQEVTQDNIGNEEESIVVRRKYKISDKKYNLEMLARYFKLLTDKHEHTGPGGGPIEYTDMTDESLKLRLEELRKLREED